MIENNISSLIKSLSEVRDSLISILNFINIEVSQFEGLLSLTDIVVRLISDDTIIDYDTEKSEDIITYKKLKDDLEEKKSLLVNTLNSANIEASYNDSLSSLAGKARVAVSKLTYFTTNNTDINLSLRGEGSVIFKDSNKEVIREVKLKNNDHTEISLSLDKRDGVVFIDNIGCISELDIHGCGITSLNTDFNTSIDTLKVYDNNLDDLDVSRLIALKRLHIYNNPIVDNCLNEAFDESENSEDIPSVNKESEAYKKLLIVLKGDDELVGRTGLADRNGQSLGSIVLYPWYGLETLVYESDGYHYRTPTDGYDFKAAPNNNTEKLGKGVICKYPRRLRFVSPSKTGNNYSGGNKDIGESPRATAGQWFTDQPLRNVIYNSDDQEDTLRSLNTVIDGIEFEEGSEVSVLYAFVRGYDIDDSTKNSDISEQVLDYYTFLRNGEEISNKSRHPLTKYNELRKALETDCTVAKNWFFGSAIQNTEDYKHCGYYFKFNGVQDIWESTQKGFGRVYGIHDVTSGNQPDWNRKNIVRFTHFFGNVADTPDNSDIKPNTYRLGRVYRTDPRTQVYDENGTLLGNNTFVWDSTACTWTPNGGGYIFGHGDHIISYLMSMGNNNSMYNGTKSEIKIFGMCPNASAYVLDRVRTYEYSAIFTSDKTRVYINDASPETRTPSSSTLPYIYRRRMTFQELKDLEMNELIAELGLTNQSSSEEFPYITMETVKEVVNNKTTYTAVVTKGVVITPDMEYHAFRQSSGGNFYASMKELYDHSDASSMSFGLGDSYYLRYLTGRFGERRFVAQSSGNDGDGCEATTEINSQRDAFGPYDTYDIMLGNNPDKDSFQYHHTAFHASALAPGGHCAKFANSSSGVKSLKASFQDYITNIGTACVGYKFVDGSLSYYNGTSMSTPITTGVILLMMNLYKLINPSYSEEPTYSSNTTRLTSELCFNDKGLLDGGFGKYSVFMDYVKTHWMSRPIDAMSNQHGLGAPTFLAEPTNIVISSKEEYECSDIEINVGDLGTPITPKAGDNTMRYSLIKSMKEPSSAAPQFTFDCAAINSKSDYTQIMPIVEGKHSIVICDNLPAYGSNPPKITENENDLSRPDGYTTYYNTYNYYNVDVTGKAQDLILLANDNIKDLIVDDNSFITIPAESNTFTIQMKICLDSSCLPDNQSNYTGGYSPVVINMDDEKDTITRVIFNNLSVKNGAVSISNANIYGNVRQRGLIFHNVVKTGNGHNYSTKTIYNEDDKSLGSYSIFPLKYLATNTTYIFTFVFKDDAFVVYINGNKVASYKAVDVSLKNVKIDGNVLPLRTTRELREKINDNILVYDRKLSDYEIAYNSAYLLQKE